MTVLTQLPKAAAIAAGALLVVSACGTREPTESAAAASTPRTTATTAVTTTTTTAAPPPVTVESVVDGRTVVLSSGVRVQVSGLAAPGECWAASATDFATKTLVGKAVRVVVQGVPVEAVESSLQVVGGGDYAILAVSEGVARAVTGAGAAIQTAEAAAKTAALGFWGPSCGGLDVKPAPPAPQPVVPQPRPEPAPAPPAPAPAYFANCAAAKAAGAAPLYRGSPGYRAGLDRDGDGVACE